MIPKFASDPIRAELKRLAFADEARTQYATATEHLAKATVALDAATAELMPAAIAWNMLTFQHNNIVELRNMAHQTILDFLKAIDSRDDPTSPIKPMRDWYWAIYNHWQDASSDQINAHAWLKRDLALIETYEAILDPGSVTLEKHST